MIYRHTKFIKLSQHHRHPEKYTYACVTVYYRVTLFWKNHVVSLKIYFCCFYGTITSGAKVCFHRADNERLRRVVERVRTSAAPLYVKPGWCVSLDLVGISVQIAVYQNTLKTWLWSTRLHNSNGPPTSKIELCWTYAYFFFITKLSQRFCCILTTYLRTRFLDKAHLLHFAYCALHKWNHVEKSYLKGEKHTILRETETTNDQRSDLNQKLMKKSNMHVFQQVSFHPCYLKRRNVGQNRSPAILRMYVLNLYDVTK